MPFTALFKKHGGNTQAALENGLIAGASQTIGLDTEGEMEPESKIAALRDLSELAYVMLFNHSGR
jgi:hypothetical protein